MGNLRRVAIGITGGIAAYKIPLLVRLLRKNGCEVKVVMTAAAKPLAGAEALRTLSGNPVYLDGAFQHDIDHIRLSEWADILIISPATANTIAKIANGIADNLLTTLALSVPEDRIIIAPAMNSAMWANRATQANISTLKARGISVLPVGEGELACGVSGPGRMLGIEEIMRHLMAHKMLSNKKLSHGGSPYSKSPENASSDSVSPKGTPPSGNLYDNASSPNKPPADDVSYGILAGKSVLISSGPTEEPIDPVRVITNKSSGKTGAALARAALSMGARVAVVSGPSPEPLPAGAEVVRVRTAAEMEREMGERFSGADICIMAAAVSDYRPANPSNAKIHRSEKESITLELVPNHDILAKLGASKSPNQFLTGFALESEDDPDRAEAKMKTKNCDMMVFNRADAALGGDTTEFTLLFRNGLRHSFAVTDMAVAAKTILANIASRVHSNGQ